jgi:hypothetical protein
LERWEAEALQAAFRTGTRGVKVPTGESPADGIAAAATTIDTTATITTPTTSPTTATTTTTVAVAPQQGGAAHTGHKVVVRGEKASDMWLRVLDSDGTQVVRGVSHNNLLWFNILGSIRVTKFCLFVRVLCYLDSAVHQFNHTL